MTPTEFQDRARTAAILAALAAVLWAGLFGWPRTHRPDFWWSFSAILVLLVGLACALDRTFRRSLAADVRTGLPLKILLGALAAAALYAAFVAGHGVIRPIARLANGVQSVYAFREGASTARIVALLAVIIGPGEELFWRAYLQRTWMDTAGPRKGFWRTAALYALVHAPSGNGILVLAALVCGVFWGWLYAWRRSVVLNAVSHTLWDLAVFVFFPFSA